MKTFGAELMRRYAPEEFGGFDITIYKPSGYVVEVDEQVSLVYTECLTMVEGVVKSQDVIILGGQYAKRVS